MRCKRKSMIAFLLALSMVVGLMSTGFGTISAEASNINYLSSQPYTPIEYDYSSSVSCGTIRYMSQITSSSYFYDSYWGSWKSQAGIECFTSSISMALSYIGISKTPKEILDYGNGDTYFSVSWGGASYLYPSVTTGMSNYINGNGKYSPPIIHLDNYTSLGHFVVLGGQVSSNVYQVVDPANSTPWNITINGSTATYVKNGVTITDTISYAYQYYNSSAVMEDTNLTEPVLSGYSVPDVLGVGEAFSVTGTVRSPETITSVTVGCYDENGSSVTSATANPNTTTYDISNLDYYIEFNTLPAGSYFYKVVITTASGTTTLLNEEFAVVDESTITIVDYSVPENVTEGDPFSVTGTIYSGQTITSVTVGCYDKNGNAMTSGTASPNATSYDISDLDYYIEFNTLSAGTYYYKVTATTASGTTVLVNEAFTVKSAAEDPDLEISISGHSVPGTMTVGDVFSVTGTIASNYTITSVTVGCYDANGNAATSGTASPNATSYDISNLDYYIEFNTLSAGNYYYKVTATTSAGTVTLVNSAFTVKAKQVAEITDYSVPTTMTEGDVFSVTGTITSDYTITSVTVGCYDGDGNAVIQDAATVNATSYDVSNLDYYIAFDQLTAGTYYYKIIAYTSGGNATLVNEKFTVKSATPEVLATITGCDVPETLTEGDVFSLTGTITSTETITEVTVGCYNKDTGVAATSASATPNATTYDVSNLDYYIEFNTLAAGNYYYKITATTASGTTVLVNEEFAVITEGSVTITDYSVPGTLTEGGVFSVTGTVTSDTTITSVTVGCYDASGNAMTSGTATPNATTYDVSNLDYYIEFNTLTAGNYYYKITATTSAGTTVLVNEAFTVKSATKIQNWRFPFRDILYQTQ